MSSPVNVDNNAPEISVIMGVYNGADTLTAAIDSILSQTFSDFEFIIVNDGSTDDTAHILREYVQKDLRIAVIEQKNMGLTKSLNRAIMQVRGKYIARQDADDISYPDRFRKQYDLFQVRPDLVLVGGCSDDLHEDGTKTLWKHRDDEELASVLFYKTPFPHSTAMMRTDTCWALGCYDENFRTAQDMELWMRFAGVGPVSMVKEPVLLRRVMDGSISTKRRWRQFHDALRARLKHGPNPALAMYHSLRSLLITFVPAAWIENLRAKCGAA
jgi:glycosyltransferase involved in cell wall biosynthesis